MKKYSTLDISKTEIVIFVALVCWIVAACFVPLPDVSSLGQ